jgi:hypothetical protein
VHLGAASELNDDLDGIVTDDDRLAEALACMASRPQPPLASRKTRLGTTPSMAWLWVSRKW